MTSYFGMMAHFITVDWELRSELLSFNELDGSHTGENQAVHMYEVLKRFKVLHKVCPICHCLLSYSLAYLHLAWLFHR